MPIDNFTVAHRILPVLERATGAISAARRVRCIVMPAAPGYSKGAAVCCDELSFSP